MNFLDIIIAVPLLWGAIRGFSKGLIIEAASLIALGIGIFAGLHFSYYITSLMGLKSEYAPFIGFIITFVLVVIAIFLLAKLLEKSLNLLALGFVNKLAGAFFSMVKFAFILSVILMFLEKADPFGSFIPKKTKESSLLYSPLKSIAPAVFPLIDFEKIKSVSDSTAKSSKSDSLCVAN